MESTRNEDNLSELIFVGYLFYVLCAFMGIDTLCFGYDPVFGNPE
jgi:hypothetical protein